MADIQQRPFVFQFVGHVHQQLLGLRAEIGGGEAQRIGAPLPGRDIEFANTAGLHDPAVGDQFPRQFVIVQPHEEVLVVHLHAALRRIEKLGPDILVLPLHLIGVRMPRAVGAMMPLQLNELSVAS